MALQPPAADSWPRHSSASPYPSNRWGTPELVRGLIADCVQESRLDAAVWGIVGGLNAATVQALDDFASRVFSKTVEDQISGKTPTVMSEYLRMDERLRFCQRRGRKFLTTEIAFVSEPCPRDYLQRYPGCSKPVSQKHLFRVALEVAANRGLDELRDRLAGLPDASGLERRLGVDLETCLQHMQTQICSQATIAVGLGMEPHTVLGADPDFKVEDEIDFLEAWLAGASTKSRTEAGVTPSLEHLVASMAVVQLH